MFHTSPARLLRNVKRMTKFLERKSQLSSVSEVPILTTISLPQTDIPPDPPRNLVIRRQPQISIPPKPNKISYRKFLSTEIVPGAHNNDRIFFSSYIDGATFVTTFVCHLCYDDHSYHSAYEMRVHLHQDHHQQLEPRLKNHPVTFPVFEDLN